MSDGGVDVVSDATVNNGWDAYSTADATGNSALAYACAECKADMTVNSSQVNNSDVNATSNVTVNGAGRSVVSTARAVGNSATYYVSGGN